LTFYLFFLTEKISNYIMKNPTHKNTQSQQTKQNKTKIINFKLSLNYMFKKD